ncbi:hypothetical protein NPA31_011725 [Aurantimonas sp. MSK8Z-1]|uniref:hypothetical protein n=1 Tax=Mangrovibrevibacter kandeliae TaxID=2968473 RepID=UPI002117B478|nr:hypothetical protein [Aurantimonas sp. MSK8Z-1]MCW4115632.1 hypothetical protein [Aurantimonas sp. MSK8Z-1]
MELTPNDLRYVVQRLPRDIRDLLSEHPGKLFLGGGFIRATIAGEVPSDIDLFGHDAEFLSSVASILADRRRGGDDRVKTHKSKNAITLLTRDRLPIQFITRWTFENARELVASFDFTVCQAAIWRGGRQPNSPWRSDTGDAFYVDLAGRRLVYTAPVRIEEAGGSLLRAIKYVKRGYSIQVSSLGAVVARLTSSLHPECMNWNEAEIAHVFGGLLREVDPLLVVDGLDVVDDHEIEDRSDG